MPNDHPDDAAQRERTRETVMRYHNSWKYRDLDAVMALYHPDIQYNDFFLNRRLGLAELRDYVLSTMPRHPDEALEHTDRIRIDGHTAFIQYSTTLHGGEGLVSFRTAEAITVRDALIWQVNEYASLVHEGRSARPALQANAAISKLGLSTRQLGFMAQDLQQYFQSRQPFLDPALNLQQVAAATGYSRNQISYLLNQVLGQSFYRYVNQARVTHLLQRLEAGSDARRLDNLAFESGFNSLTAFYRAFRRHTGASPKAYLNARTREQDKPSISF